MKGMVFVLITLVGLVLMAGTTAGADLDMLDVSVWPSTVYEGQTMTIYCNITNNGSAVGAEPWDSNVEFKVGEKIVSEINTGNMSVGETRQMSTTYQTSDGDAGNKKVRARIMKEDEQEGNNARNVDIVIQEASPDLTPKDISFDRATIVDTYVTLTALIANEGTAPGNQAEVTLHQGTTLLGSQAVNVPAGDSTDVDITFYLSTVGEYDFKVNVDPQNDIDEMEEGNNELIETRNVTEPGQDDKPDFEVSVGNWPENYAIGQVLTIEATIWNNGTRGWSTNFTNVSLVLNGSAVANTTASVAANHYITVMLEWNIIQDSGEYELKVEVDPLDVINETDENDNSQKTDIVIKPPETKDNPDLAVFTDDITLFVGGEVVNENSTITEETDVTILVNVHNFGNLSVKSVPIVFYIDDVEIKSKTFSMDGLWDSPSGAEKTQNAVWSSVVGEHTLKIAIDPDLSGALNETDDNGSDRRSNNFVQMDITIVAGDQPDFLFDMDSIGLFIEGSPTTEVDDNTTVVLEFTIENKGKVAGDVTINVYDSPLPMPESPSGAILARFDYDDLSVDGSETETVEWLMNGTGTHYLRMIAVTPEDKDLNMSNNEAQLSIRVEGVPLPDLKITKLELETDKPLRNESVEIYYTINNTGDVDTEDNFYIQISLFTPAEIFIDKFLHTERISAGSSANLTYDWVLDYIEAGDYKLRITLDPLTDGDPAYGFIREIDEGNNLEDIDISPQKILQPDVGFRDHMIKFSNAWDPVLGTELLNSSAPHTNRESFALVSGRTVTLWVTVYNEGSSDMTNLTITGEMMDVGESGVTIPFKNKKIGLLNESESRLLEYEIDSIPVLDEVQLWSLSLAVETTESSEVKEKRGSLDNNYFLGETWIIPDWSDPVLKNVKIDPALPVIFQDVYFNVTIANLGPKDYEGNLTFFVDSKKADMTKEDVDHGSLNAFVPAGGELTLNFTYVFESEKSYNLRFRAVMSKFQLDDTNDDKVVNLPVALLEGVEFSITNIEVPTLEKGKRATITVTVKNTGGTAKNDVPVKLSFDGGTIAEKAVTIQGLGAETTVDFIWIPGTVGTFTLTATVNPLQTINEPDYDNNDHSEIVIVGDAEDEKAGAEDTPVLIIAIVIVASIAAGVGIFFLMKRY